MAVNAAGRAQDACSPHQMKLTRFTDYSLRVLIYLAARPGQRATIAEIATSYSIAQNHLVKVVHFLGKSGWVATARGATGGVELASAPEKIRVGSVVRAAEGAPVLAECFEPGGDCPIYEPCRLRGVFEEALTAFMATLDRYTVADMVSNSREISRILFPEARLPRGAAPRADAPPRPRR